MPNQYSESDPMNIVLVGRAGNGKSASGNSIVKGQRFRSGAQATGVTMTCQTFRAVTNDRHNINVIDTPGLFDLITSSEFISKEIIRCLALAEEGLHAVVLVLSVRNRFTKEEEDALCTLQILFGGEILDYLIVLFTGGDELEADNQTLEPYLNLCPEFLKNIFRLCEDRTVLFNNRTTDEEKKEQQVQQLLDHVTAIGRKNRGRPFTEQRHRKIKEETIRLREAERAAEARLFAEAELAREKRRLREFYDHNMREMARLLEVAVRDAWEANERAVYLMENAMAKKGKVPPKRCNIM